MGSYEVKPWQEFIGDIASFFEQGADESEISSRFLGACIEGSGVVLEIKLSEKYASGVALKMSPETIDMPKKHKVLRCDYIFLSVEEGSKRDWVGCRVGETVGFRAKIPGSNGPFSAIRLSEYDGEPEVILMMKLRECELTTHS